MKKLSAKIVLLLLIIQNSFGQFHKLFYNANGFILSQGASITHIAMAGGGVVLKGIAKPKNPDSLSVFTTITFDEANGISTMHIQTPGSNLSFSDSSWLMRDAAMLVKSEKVDEMYRDVNLLGHFTDKDLDKNYDILYPADKYYNVEMADSLRNTKSGETLLLLDIMLASNSNTKYYSNNIEAYYNYINSKDSLEHFINRYNDSVRYKNINDTYFKLKNFDSLKNSGKLDSSEIIFINKVEEYSFYYLFKSRLGYAFSNYYDSVKYFITKIDSLFKVDYSNSINLMPLWNDYTYNDENTNYTFFTNYNKQLKINGEPNYTFLQNPYLYLKDDVKVDSIFTNYFTQHPTLIKNLNYSVVTNAEHFGKASAFYRYLKIENPKLWNQIYTHYLHIRKTKGQTPRFIGNNPSHDSDY